MKHSDTYTSFLRTHVHFTVYEPKVIIRVKGIVQIHHGMGEYVDRYDHFASYLLNQGYVVIVSDFAGHGKSLINFEQGYFGDKDALQLLIKDMHHLQHIMMERYPDIPYFMLGVDLGSLLIRKYASIYGDYIQGMILLSTVRTVPNRLLKSIKLYMMKLFKGTTYHPYKTIEKYRKKMDQKFGGEHLSYLMKDKLEKKKYSNDSMTHFAYTVQGYRDVIKIIRDVNSYETLQKTPNYLATLICDGKEDLMTKKGLDAKLIYRDYKNKGMEDVTLKLYPEGRHSLLFDENKKDVYLDILHWLDERTYL